MTVDHICSWHFHQEALQHERGKNSALEGNWSWGFLCDPIYKYLLNAWLSCFVPAEHFCSPLKRILTNSFYLALLDTFIRAEALIIKTLNIWNKALSCTPSPHFTTPKFITQSELEQLSLNCNWKKSQLNS